MCKLSGGCCRRYLRNGSQIMDLHMQKNSLNVLVVVFDRHPQVERGFAGVVTGRQEFLTLQHALLPVPLSPRKRILAPLIRFLRSHCPVTSCPV